MYTIYAVKHKNDETFAQSDVSLEELYDLFDYYYLSYRGEVFSYNIEEPTFFYDIEFNEKACAEVNRYEEAHDCYASLKHNDPNPPFSFFHALLNEHFIVNEEEACEWYHDTIDYHIDLFFKQQQEN